MDILASLPAYGALLEQLQQWGEQSPCDEQWLALDEFELEVQEMCQALHAQCLDFLYDEELRNLIDPILVAYQLTYAAIDAMREAWFEGEPWQEHWEKARAQLTSALEGYPQLASWYERQPRLSPSPYIHELLRVGRACLAEMLPWEAFSLRLEHYVQVLEQFCQRRGGHEALRADHHGNAFLADPADQASLDRRNDLSLIDPHMPLASPS